MTENEASKTFNIPISVLREYESWGLCGEVKKVMGDWKYDDSDIEKLSMIMTLHDIGFSNEDVRRYMELLVSDSDTEMQRMAMLNRMRSSALDEIHFKEKKLERMDYLRHEIAMSMKGKELDKQQN